MKRVMLTQEEAQAIVDAHEIRLEDGDEETELLEANNPTLYAAYQRILKIADGQ
jgi:hypothetical protein